MLGRLWEKCRIDDRGLLIFDLEEGAKMPRQSIKKPIVTALRFLCGLRAFAVGRHLFGSLNSHFISVDRYRERSLPLITHLEAR